MHMSQTEPTIFIETSCLAAILCAVKVACILITNIMKVWPTALSLSYDLGRFGGR